MKVGVVVAARTPRGVVGVLKVVKNVEVSEEEEQECDVPEEKADGRVRCCLHELLQKFVKFGQVFPVNGFVEIWLWSQWRLACHWH